MKNFSISPETKEKFLEAIKKIKSKEYYTKTTVYNNFIDDPDNFLGQIVEKIIVFCILISAITIIFESVWNNFEIYEYELFLIDFVVSVIFWIEYIYRFYKAPKKIKFSLNVLNVIDLLSFLPFFIEIFIKQNTWMDALKILRLFRVFRIFRILRHMPIIVGFMRALKDYKDEYKSIWFLMITTMIVVSVFVYFLESGVEWTKFVNVPITLWWALVTMTTVWYWDMVPTTTLWKIFGSIIILLWPVLLALTSSITTLVFIETSKIQRQFRKKSFYKTCPRCNIKNERKNNYCYSCWEKLF